MIRHVQHQPGNHPFKLAWGWRCDAMQQREATRRSSSVGGRPRKVMFFATRQQTHGDGDGDHATSVVRYEVLLVHHAWDLGRDVMSDLGTRPPSMATTVSNFLSQTVRSLRQLRMWISCSRLAGSMNILSSGYAARVPDPAQRGWVVRPLNTGHCLLKLLCIRRLPVFGVSL